MFARPNAGQLKQLGRINCAAGQYDLATDVHALFPSILVVANTTSAFSVEQYLQYHRFGLNAQVRPLHDRLQIAHRRGAAPSVSGRDLEVSDAFLICAVKIIVSWNPGFLRRLYERIADLSFVTDIRNLQWSVGAVVVVRTSYLIFRFHEKWQYVVIAPAVISQLTPVIVIFFLAANIDQAVDRARAAQHFASGPN